MDANNLRLLRNFLSLHRLLVKIYGHQDGWLTKKVYKAGKPCFRSSTHRRKNKLDVFPSYTIPKPTDDQILLWFQAVLLWMISNYTSIKEPTEQIDVAKLDLPFMKKLGDVIFSKAWLTAACCIILPGVTMAHWTPRVLLFLTFLFFTSTLPRLRVKWAKQKVAEDTRVAEIEDKNIRPTEIKKAGNPARLAEIEIVGNLGLLVTSATIIVLGGMHIYPTIRVSLSDRHLAVILAMVSGTLFIVRGGTRIVRGVLDDSGASPKIKDVVKEETEPASQIRVSNRDSPVQVVDSKEYNRGRLIGDIERLLLLIVVIAGKDETLGLIIVAKGLIRSRQFENRDLAEYVIIGTLVSTLIAIAVGLGLKYISTMLW